MMISGKSSLGADYGVPFLDSQKEEREMASLYFGYTYALAGGRPTISNILIGPRATVLCKV